jgi:hypothetical protein
MAISKVFTDESGTSAEGNFSGNADLSIKGLTKGVVLLEVKYPGSTKWSKLAGFSGATPDVDKLLVAGDSAVLYRFRSIGVMVLNLNRSCF